MQMTRPNARWLLIVVTLTALLFSRLALASYVCPQPQLLVAASAGDTQNHGCAQPGDHSHMVDEVQPSLCAAHSSDEKQLSNAAAQLAASEPVLLFLYPVSSPPLSLAWPASAYADLPNLVRGDSALFLQTLRLRI